MARKEPAAGGADDVSRSGGISGGGSEEDHFLALPRSPSNPAVGTNDLLSSHSSPLKLFADSTAVCSAGRAPVSGFFTDQSC